MTLLQQAGAAVLLLSITLSLQCAGAAALIFWIRSIPRETREAQSVSLCRARYANHSSCHRTARDRYSAVGELLSLALPSVLGICVLLLGEQLCDGWIRGCGASVKVAPVGTAGKHGWHADVRSLHWTSLRGGYSPGGRQLTVSSTTSPQTHEFGSNRLAKRGHCCSVGRGPKSFPESNSLSVRECRPDKSRHRRRRDLSAISLLRRTE